MSNRNILIKSQYKVVWQLLGIACLLFPLFAQALTVKADRTQVPLNETFQLLITESGADLDGIDLKSIEERFDIVSRSEQSEYSIVNGRTESRRRLSLTLAPRQKGRFVIPALTHQRKRSTALEIEVVDAVIPPAEMGDASIFLQATTDKSQAYVGEQVIYTLGIFYRIGLGNAELSNLELSVADSYTLEDRSFDREINGERYKVVEKRVALFFNEPGEMRIPGQTLTAVLSQQSRSRFGFDPFSRGREIKLAAEALTLRIEPPAMQPGKSAWLPAQQLELTETWSQPKQLAAGEPVTRVVRLFGKGLPAESLPTLPEQALQGSNSYREKPSLSNHEWQQGLSAQREETIVYIPTNAGELELPEYSVDWFNTGTGQWQQAKLPARTFKVLPAADEFRPHNIETAAIEFKANRLQPSVDDQTSADFTESANNQRTVLFWQLLAVVACVGWVGSLLLLYFSRKRKALRASAEHPDTTGPRSTGNFLQATAQIIKACRDNAAQASRLWPGWRAQLDQQLAGYTHLESSAELAQILVQCDLIDRHGRQLNAAVYAGSSATNWDGNAMAADIEELLASINRLQKQSSSSANALPPLYPRKPVN